MILNKVVLSNGFGSIIHIGDVDGRTNSSVNIYHDYRLVYEIEGADRPSLVRRGENFNEAGCFNSLMDF